MLGILLGIIILLVLMLSYILVEESREARRNKSIGKLEEWWGRAERRRARRMDTQLNIKYRLLKSKGNNRQSLSKNITRLGACLLLDEKLPKGALLELEIESPLLNSSIFTRARIIWAKETSLNTEKRTFHTGVKFFDMDQDNQKKLSEFIGSLRKLK